MDGTVCLVIVNYRTPEMTRTTALQAWKLCGDDLAQVVVVDNSATDSGDALDVWPVPEITTVDAGGNVGFAAAVNAAIASVPDARAYWVLNPDAEPDEQTLRAALRAVDAGFGIVGSRVIGPDGLIQSDGGSGLVRAGWVRHKDVGASPGPSADRPYETAWVHGASFVISQEVIRAVGPLDEGYFLYFEETAYCFTARRHGFKVGVATSSKVRHQEAASFAMTGTRSLRDVYLSRNYVRFARHTLPRAERALTTPLWFLSVLLIRVVRRDWARAKLHLEGAWRGFRGESGQLP